MAGPLKYFFDYVSPYSYLAWTQVHALAERHGRVVESVPVLLGAILKARGAVAPADNPARLAYLVKDTVRLAHVYGVPFVAPSVFPFSSIFALRVTSVPMPAASRRALIDRLYHAAWGEGKGVTDRAVVADAVAGVGLPAPVLTDAESPEGKARLHAQTAEALALGTFGAPTFVVDGELFFGNDGLPHLERFLLGKDPLR